MARTTETRVDLELARKTLQAEGEAILRLSERLGEPFETAADMLHRCSGFAVTTGVGKAGIIARKVSATLASTGTQSLFLHPVEALHGDLGRVRRQDVVVAFSHSGASEELVRLLDYVKGLGAALVAVTGEGDSPLGRHADVCLCYGQVQEACPLGLAPTVSTVCMLAMGDALALTVMQMRHFTREDFAAFHPAGNLGRTLMKVEEAMIDRSDARCEAVAEDLPLAEALHAAEQAQRRSGAMLLVDAQGRLSGILTDADLRRLLVRDGGSGVLLRPVREVMTRDPIHVSLGGLVSEALAMMTRHRIDELPVVDAAGRPVGLIDVQDLLGIKAVTDGRR